MSSIQLKLTFLEDEGQGLHAFVTSVASIALGNIVSEAHIRWIIWEYKTQKMLLNATNHFSAETENFGLVNKIRKRNL